MNIIFYYKLFVFRYFDIMVVGDLFDIYLYNVY